MYIGNDLQIANPSYKIIDDISSSFNGSTTSFALQVSGVTPVPFPINEQQVMISVNGVVQEPDSSGSAGFKLLGSNIIFSSAPANGNAFFGVILAGADYVTAGSEFPDGTVNAPSFTFSADQDSGWYRIGSGSTGYTSNGVQILNFDGNGLNLPDNKKIQLGGSSDLQLHHNGTDSNILGSQGDLYIHNTGANADDINIRAQDDILIQVQNGESAINCIGDGSVELYFNNLRKFRTVSDGCEINSEEGAAAILALIADEGDDNADYWRIQSDTSGNFKVGTYSTGSWVDSLVIDSSGRAGIGTSPNTTYKSIIKNTTYGVLRLETNLTGGDGAYLDLMHNSSSPADDDNLGVLGFQGKNSANEEITYAQIRSYSRDVTDATEDGDLTFHTRAAGSFGERMRLDSSGRLLIGTTTEGDSLADNLTISDSGDTGITLRSGTSSTGSLYFSDGTTGSAEKMGEINYYHGNNGFQFKTAATLALTINGDQNTIFSGRIVGARVGNSALATPSLELYGSQSGATFGDLRVHNWGDASGDYWQINTNLGLDSNGNTDKVDDSKKGAGITIDGRAGRIFLKTSHDGTSATTDCLLVDSGGNSTFGGNITLGYASAAGKKLYFQSTSGAAQYIASGGTNNGDLLIGSSAGEFMRIDSSGRLSIQGAATKGVLDVRASGGSNTKLTAVFGANEGTTAGTLTDGADKGARIGFHHYDNDEEAYAFVSCGGTSTANAINFGGGTSLMNAATALGFFTATNNTTTTGLKRAEILTDGTFYHYHNGSDVKVAFGGTGQINGIAGLPSLAGTPLAVARDTGSVRSAHFGGHLKFDSGYGIDFGATSDATGKSSEILNDYEEGTWSPSFGNYQAGTGSWTYASQQGAYTKIGRQVTAWFYVAVTAMATLPGGGGTGDYLVLGNLPFTSANSTPNEGGTVSINWWRPEGTGCSASGNQITGFVQKNYSRMLFGQRSHQGIAALSPVAYFGSSTGSFSSNAYLYGVVTYYV